tara:strand:+ start:1487 stop:2146 length:660 start_codon:yes stop_codon:yes gene_type:complete
MSLEETPTEDTGEAFGSDADPVSPAEATTAEASESQQPSADDAFGSDGTDASEGDQGSGSEQEAAGPPEQYEAFNFPEGFAPDEEGMKTFSEEVREMGFNQSQAQKHLDSLINWKAREEANMQAQRVELSAAWTQASRAAGLMTSDSRNMASVGLKALDHDGSAAAQLKQLGLDRHPAIVAAFKAYGTSISADSSVPSVGSDSGQLQRNAAQILYPDQS